MRKQQGTRRGLSRMSCRNQVANSSLPLSMLHHSQDVDDPEYIGTVHWSWIHARHA
jgi:hypothetical protein